MANSIDELSIQITADAKKATSAIDDLCKKLSRLSGSINNINVSKFSNKMSKVTTSATKASKALEKVSNKTKGNGGNANYQLAYAFDNLGYSLKRVNNKINSFFSNLIKGEKTTKNFAQTVGLLYARFFLLIRGVKLLGNAIKSSMNYLETLNYFNSAFGQVANNAVSEWSKAGYDSAQAYADSFSERAKQVTAKMTGFTPNKDGTLTATGLTSLGLNPNELMNYQAQYAQMASSMGVTSENALKLSEVLTKIGADLASVKNMEFADVWKDMASGLVGMSRTLDKYGVNIRNVNMQEKLAELGIEAKVSALNQQDKALLRTIILLDSTKYAWADLSETLNTPANQFRILTANIQQLGRMIGNIFLPIIAKVLPYINGLVIALQRLFAWVAKLLHIDLSGLTSNKGADNSGISDMLDDADDLASGLDDANDNAKKLKRTVLGFDELNILSKKDDESGKDLGSLGGLLNDAFASSVDEYLKAWEDAFKELENKAKDIADKIANFFKRLFDPILKAFAKYGEYIKTAWTRAFKKIGELLQDIGRDFWKVWEERKTQEIFENIAKIIGDIGVVVGNLAQKLRDAWNANDNGLRIFTAIRDIVAVIVEHVRNITASLMDWSSNLDLEPLFTTIANFMEDLVPVFDAIYGVFEDFFIQVLEPLGKWVLEKGLPDLLQVLDDFVNKIDWEYIRTQFSELWKHLEPFAERVGEGLILFVDEIADKIADWVNDGGFERFLERIEKWLDNFDAEDAHKSFWVVIDAIIALKGAVAVFTIAKGFSEIITIIKNLKDVCGGKTATNISKTSDAIKNGFSAIKDGLGYLAKVNPEAFALFANNLVDLLRGTLLDPDTWSESKNEIVKAIGDVFDAIGATLDIAVDAIIQLLDNMFSWEHTKEIFKGAEENFKKGGMNIVLGIVDGIGGAIMFLIEPILQIFETVWETFCNAFDIHSPSRKMAELGNYVILGFIEGFQEFFYQFTDAFQTFWNNYIAPWFDKNKWLGLYDSIKTALETKWNEVVAWWKDNAFTKWWKDHVQPHFEANKWSEVYQPIKDKLSEKWNETAEWWKTNVGKWWDEHVIKRFAKDKWQTALKDVKGVFSSVFGDAFEDVKGKAKDMYDSIVGWVNDMIQKVKDLIAKLKEAKESKSSSSSSSYSSGTSYSFSSGSSYSISVPKINISIPNIPKFANGGMPEDGFFFANHNELVGGFRGKTAVANNDQITNGIKSAVYDAMMAVMSSSGGFGGSGDVIVNAVLKTENDEVLARAVTRGQQSLNRRYNAVY